MKVNSALISNDATAATAVWQGHRNRHGPNHLPGVFVSHLGPTPFALEIARALEERGRLSCFATTYTWGACPQIESALERLWPKLAMRFARRTAHGIPPAKVRGNPYGELCRMAVAAATASRRVDDFIFHRVLYSFDRWVASQLNADLAGVYGYEYGCLATFRRAKELGIKCFYDAPAPEHDFVEDILTIEYRRFPELNTASRRYLLKRQATRTERRRHEWQLADAMFVASEFSRDSYVAAGMPRDRTFVIPYGAPEPQIAGVEGGSQGKGPLRCVWAGTFSIRKGAHYLLEAWRAVASPHLRLDIYGAMGLPSSLARDLPEGITFHGGIGREDLYAAYRAADLLVFPTLCDGFGLVVNEALANGLPVVTTPNAGASSLIIDGENGRVIPTHDAIAVAGALQWALDNRAALARMRQSAIASVAGWRWGDYREAVGRTFDGLISGDARN